MDSTVFIDKARQNLVVAEWCYNNSHYDACCNRAYYAMFQAALAALIYDNIKIPDGVIAHPWVHGNFAAHFCNQRKIFPQFRDFLHKAQTLRNRADYKPIAVTRSDARRLLKECKTFVDALLKGMKSHDDI